MDEQPQDTSEKPPRKTFDVLFAIAIIAIAIFVIGRLVLNWSSLETRSTSTRILYVLVGLIALGSMTYAGVWLFKSKSQR